MGRPVNQHWVPQFYLREFAIPETRATKNPLVWIFSRNEEDGIEKKTNIRNICAKRYLYSPRGDSRERDWLVENRLGDLERVLSGIWHDVAWGYIDLGSDTIRKGLALFIATMHMRQPSNQDDHKWLHAQLVDMCEKAPKNADGIPNIESVTYKNKEYKLDSSGWDSYKSWGNDEHHRFFNQQILTETIHIAEILMKKRWSIVVSDSEHFITSDNPVVLEHPSRQVFGFGTKGVVVSFPLSPNRILMMDDRHQKPCNQYYQVSEKNVGAFNYGIWCAVSRFLITGRPIPDVLSEMAEFIEKNVNH
jgi:hypothetical protein